MPELVTPSVAYYSSWLESHEEWGGAHQDGSGLRPGEDVSSPAAFAQWVARLQEQGDPAVALEAGRVHADYWWVVDGGTYLGAITLRHELNDSLLQEGGHIGYGIRPSARRHGLATWALAKVLPRARARGLNRVLITCADGNIGSAAVIESNGGRLEDVRETGLGLTRRYWIAL